MAELPADIIELDFPVDLGVARKALSPSQIISGNLSTVTVLLNDRPEEVYAAAAECHAQTGSRFIVGSGCELSPFTPLENVRALVRYAEEHRP